jgi:hypothetical protein
MELSCSCQIEHEVVHVHQHARLRKTSITDETQLTQSSMPYKNRHYHFVVGLRISSIRINRPMGNDYLASPSIPFLDVRLPDAISFVSADPIMCFSQMVSR